MIDAEVQSELLKQLEQLSLAKQWKVLGFARTLADAGPRGVPGTELLDLCGSLPAEDAQEMIQAIEEECERIDPNEW
jgi:divalent metal cation (Fe/Co/Zn/Cd) transporter